ncbi:MAG: hydroxymethylglutaryl-CoA lyase [Rhodospirillales bacterium]|jgi:hydroxymethylglutaryl-CoA lyase|nr:hydroxymethylglutaryl-CoA lyase [Rhodospirillales bacterium]
MSLPTKVTLHEVAPRDGLQNEPGVIPAAVKIELIERLAGCGLGIIEAAAFVSPRAVPQMGDAAEVMGGLSRKAGIIYSVLVPNMKGLEGALAADVDWVAVFGAASESFSERNINCSMAESLDRFRPVCEAAAQAKKMVRAYISCALGCPFEGAVAPSVVAEMAEELIGMGVGEVVLSDTIGVADPATTERLIEAVAARLPLNVLAGHYHDTYGQALANILKSLEMGITVFDASVGGLGGCPFAPGASGNVATEDVLYMLDGMGIETGVDLAALVDTAWFISGALDREPGSSVARALRAS